MGNGEIVMWVEIIKILLLVYLMVIVVTVTNGNGNGYNIEKDNKINKY